MEVKEKGREEEMGKETKLQEKMNRGKRIDSEEKKGRGQHDRKTKD